MAAMGGRRSVILGVSVLIVAFALADASIQRYYMNTRCGGTLDMGLLKTPGFRFSLTQYNKYRPNMNCRTTIKAPPGQRLLIRFLKIDIDTHFLSCQDHVSIFDVVGRDNVPVPVPGMMQLCGEREPRHTFYSTGDSAIIHFISNQYDQDDGFSLLVTAFHEGACNATEFKCGNGRCIGKTLKCNGYNNCGDGSDHCGLKTSHIAVIIVTIILIGIFVAAVFFICRRRRMHKGQVVRSPGASAVPLQTMNQGGYPQTQPIHQPTGPPGYPPPGSYPPPGGYPPQGYPPQGYPPQPYPPGGDMAPPPYPGNPYGYGNPEKPPQ